MHCTTLINCLVARIKRGSAPPLGKSKIKFTQPVKLPKKGAGLPGKLNYLHRTTLPFGEKSGSTSSMFPFYCIENKYDHQ